MPFLLLLSYKCLSDIKQEILHRKLNAWSKPLIFKEFFFIV